MKKTITLIAIALVFGFTVKAQVLQLGWAATAPSIDGVADDNDPWGAEWISMDSVIGSTTDCVAKFQILNDAENLYMVVSITDATPNNNGALGTDDHLNDNVEVFTSFHTPSGDVPENRVTGQDFQFRTSRTNVITGDFSAEGIVSLDGYQTVAGGDNAGYVVEFAWPLSDLASDTDFDGSNFRFDVQVADVTEGSSRTQQSFWNNSSDKQWQVVDILGAAKLATNDVAVREDTKAKVSARINGQNLNVRNMTGVVYVYDVTGKLMLKADAKETINVSALKAGIYIVKNNKSSVKVLK